MGAIIFVTDIIKAEWTDFFGGGGHKAGNITMIDSFIFTLIWRTVAHVATLALIRRHVIVTNVSPLCLNYEGDIRLFCCYMLHYGHLHWLSTVWCSSGSLQWVYRVLWLKSFKFKLIVKRRQNATMSWEALLRLNGDSPRLFTASDPSHMDVVSSCSVNIKLLICSSSKHNSGYCP